MAARRINDRLSSFLSARSRLDKHMSTSRAGGAGVARGGRARGLTRERVQQDEHGHGKPASDAHEAEPAHKGANMVQAKLGLQPGRGQEAAARSRG